MDSDILDQARGLRRLLGGKPVDEFVFCSAFAEPGRPWALINLASALRLAGATVLIIDAATGHAGGALNSGITRDQLNIAAMKKSLNEYVRYGPEDIPFLGVQSLSDWATRDPSMGPLSLRNSSGDDERVDIVLINAPTGREVLMNEGAAHPDLIISVQPKRESVAKTYQLIQSESERQANVHFRVLVSGAASPREGCRLFEALSLATKRALHVELSFLGVLPLERYLRSAAMRGRTVVHTDPHTWTAKSFRQMADALLRQRTEPASFNQALSGLVAS